MNDKLISVTPAKRFGGIIRLLMSVPGSHVMFVGPRVCSRHDILASLYLYYKRTSQLVLNEADIISGNMLQLIDNAVEEIITKGEEKPKAFMIYTGCQDCLMGTDYSGIISDLKEKYNIPFSHFVMNHMPMVGGRSTLAKICKGMFSLLKESDKCYSTVNYFGALCDLKEDNELIKLLDEKGVTNISTLKATKTFDEFRLMSRARLNIITNKDYIEVANDMEERFNIPWIYLPISYNIDEVSNQYENLSKIFNCDFNIEQYKKEAIENINKALEEVGQTPLELDLLGISRPYNLTKTMVEYGFNIKTIYIIQNDYIDDECEIKSLKWIRENASYIELNYERITINPKEQITSEDNLFHVEGEYFGFTAINHLMNLIKGDQNI